MHARGHRCTRRRGRHCSRRSRRGAWRRQDDRYRQGCREGDRCTARRRADDRLERFRDVEPDRAVRRGASRRRRRTPRQKSRRRAGRQRRNRPGAHPLLSGGHRGRVIQDLRGSTVPAVWRPEFLWGASARCCWRAGRSLLRRDQRMRRRRRRGGHATGVHRRRRSSHRGDRPVERPRLRKRRPVTWRMHCCAA
jgi:hypothetical protein